MFEGEKRSSFGGFAQSFLETNCIPVLRSMSDSNKDMPTFTETLGTKGYSHDEQTPGIIVTLLLSVRSYYFQKLERLASPFM